MPPVDLPNLAEIAHTYTELVRRQVTAKATDPWFLGQQPKAYLGVYEDNAREISAVWACDAGLAASLGAVLTLIPAAMAIEAAKAAALPEDLLDNCREIANITANNFHGKRVRLTHFLAPGTLLPAALSTFLSGATRRADLAVTVAGYPGGRLTMIAS